MLFSDLRSWLYLAGTVSNSFKTEKFNNYSGLSLLIGFGFPGDRAFLPRYCVMYVLNRTATDVLPWSKPNQKLCMLSVFRHKLHVHILITSVFVPFPVKDVCVPDHCNGGSCGMVSGSITHSICTGCPAGKVGRQCEFSKLSYYV